MSNPQTITDLRLLWNDLRQQHEQAYRADLFGIAASTAEHIAEVCKCLAFEQRSDEAGVVSKEPCCKPTP